MLGGDAAQAHAKGVKTKPHALGTVVKPVMVVAVKAGAHAQAAGQLVDGSKPMRVRAGSLVRDQNFGPLPSELVVIDQKNGAALRQWQAAAPEVAFAAVRHVVVVMLEGGQRGRSPHSAAKNAAQSGNAQASDFDCPAMQVALDQG